MNKEELENIQKTFQAATKGVLWGIVDVVFYLALGTWIAFKVNQWFFS